MPATRSLRASLVLWIMFVCVSTVCFFSGRPPADAQAILGGVQMSLTEYNQQRIGVQQEQLRGFAEFKVNQEQFNREQAQRVNEQLASIRAEQASMAGQERGAFGLLTLLGGFAVFFQIKKSSTK